MDVPRAKLTDKFIRAAKCAPGSSQIDYFDSGLTGLSLRVTAHGRKVFTLRYRIRGKQKRLTLGTFGDQPNQLLLRDARTRAAELLVKVKNGEDPAVERQRQRAAEIAPNSVSDTVELYLARLRRRGRRESYLYDITKRLHLHVTPLIGDKPISEVSAADIAKILRPLEAAGKSTTHNRLLTMLRPLFELAKVDDPTKEFEKLPERPKEDWFTLQELAKIWIALDHPDAKVHTVTALTIRLAMLTLKRAGEVAGALTSEIDGELWHIPSSRMKGRRSEVVPLSTPALEIIENAKTLPYRRDDCEAFVFPSLTKADSPIERNAMSRAFPRTRRIAGLENHGGSLHSLRHSGATYLASMGTSALYH